MYGKPWLAYVDTGNKSWWVTQPLQREQAALKDPHYRTSLITSLHYSALVCASWDLAASETSLFLSLIYLSCNLQHLFTRSCHFMIISRACSDSSGPLFLLPPLLPWKLLYHGCSVYFLSMSALAKNLISLFPNHIGGAGEREDGREEGRERYWQRAPFHLFELSCHKLSISP